MYRYNVIAIGEDRATLGSEPSASIAAYSRGRYLSWYRPLIAHICCCPQCGKSVFFTALAHKPTLEFTNFFGVEPLLLSRPNLQFCRSLISTATLHRFIDG